MRRRRDAFTMVELLVVIAIIAVLIGLVLMGVNSYQRRINERDTRTTLQSLMAMLKENAGTMPATPTGYPNPLFVTDVTIGGNDRTGVAVRYTRTVLAKLRAVPANKTAFGNFPTDKLFTFGGAGDPMGNVPVPLDAWGNPIIYVPGPDPRRPAGPANTGGLKVTVKNQVVIIRAPNDRGFWASAGSDGNFQTGDDNIYPFNQ